MSNKKIFIKKVVDKVDEKIKKIEKISDEHRILTTQHLYNVLDDYINGDGMNIGLNREGAVDYTDSIWYLVNFYSFSRLGKYHYYDRVICPLEVVFMYKNGIDIKIRVNLICYESREPVFDPERKILIERYQEPSHVEFDGFAWFGEDPYAEERALNEEIALREEAAKMDVDLGLMDVEELALYMKQQRKQGRAY